MSIRSEWEWGWNTPLLLRPSSFAGALPDPVAKFLSTPLDAIDFSAGSPHLGELLADLRTSRIGFRFEKIQTALFKSHPDTASLRTNIVVPGKTEIDLLHRLRTWPEGWIHWEVAVKFYLGLDVGGSSDAFRFVGPSLKDSLGKKMRVIQTRQLAALLDPVLRQELGIAPTDSVYTAPYVKGVLFLPVAEATEVRRPEFVSELGARGVWMTISEFPKWVDQQTATHSHARILVFKDRKDWIRMPEPGSDTPVGEYLASEDFRDLQAMLAKGAETPPHHGSLRSAGLEIRFFIVDDEWPKRAEAMVDRMQGASSIKE